MIPCKYQEVGGTIIFSLTLFRASALHCTGGWVLGVCMPLTFELTAGGLIRARPLLVTCGTQTQGMCLHCYLVTSAEVSKPVSQFYLFDLIFNEV